MRRLIVALALTGLLAGLAAASVSAGTYTATAPVLASPGPSLFAVGCGGSGEGGGAFLYENSEVEPWFAVNPTDPLNLVGFIQQDRWSDGGAHGLQVLVSDDGGDHWTRADSPDFSRCAGAGPGDPGYYERSSDPWVSFSPNGRLHAISLSTDRSTARNAVLASWSDDGGHSWSEPWVIRADNSRSGPLANLFNDKESITADPTDSDFVYAVWDRIASPNENPLTPPQAYANSLAWHGPAWFSRSTDNGLTWERAHPIFAPKASRTQTIGNQIVVLPDEGTVIDGFNYIVTSKNRQGIRGDNVAVIFSDDKGETWSDVTLVAKMGDRGVRDPEPVAQCRPDQPEDALCTLVRTGDILPEFAVDYSTTGTRGNLYAVWQSHKRGVTAGGRPVDDTIMLARSTDGGETWGDPIRVSKTPDGVYNGQAFTSSVDVAANGDVAVTYYDFRNDVAGDDELSTDYWIVHSHDGGQTFGDETRLTTDSFDMRKAPYARGYFVGDYEGLDHSGNVFQPFFVQTYDVDADVSGNVDSANRTDAFWSTAGP